MERLKKFDKFAGRKGPLLLIIMDGIGIGRQDESNAVYLADTPTLDTLFRSRLYTEITAHGEAVGLPSDEDMGNSEVGHNALGAGRIFDQGAKKVNRDFDSGAVFQSTIWEKIVARGKKGGAVHCIGLLSDGNVHSNISHLYGIVRKLAELGIGKVRIHPLLDGRDVGPKTALTYVGKTEALLAEIRNAGHYDYAIASGGGRMNVTMDRYDSDWDIVKRGWNAHVHGIGRKFKSCAQAIETYYSEGLEDQYLGEFVIVDDEGDPVGKMQDGDSVILFNFRGDRALEISRAFDSGPQFDKFDRGRKPDVFYAGIMEYDSEAKIPEHFLVQPPMIQNTVGEYLAREKITMFALSETQKYGHVTYFWNGNRSGYIDKDMETYVEIPSDRINFDAAPKMKAVEITDKATQLLKSGKYRFGRINFPNGDMVGHTGVMEAAIVAVETVDKAVGKLIEVVTGMDGITIVTADHGNADEMFTIKGGHKEVKTSHTLNKVPFAIVDPEYRGEYQMAGLARPGLANVAATICNFLGYEKPAEYEPSLLSFGS